MNLFRTVPFCWQELEVLRLLTESFNGSELVKMRCLYGAITELQCLCVPVGGLIDSVKTISRISGLGQRWVSRGLKKLEGLGIIRMSNVRKSEGPGGGQFHGKTLIFTGGHTEIAQKIGIKPADGGIPPTPPYVRTNGTLDNSKYKDLIVQVVQDLNEQTGKKFSPRNATTVKLISGRISEGRTLEEFQKVIRIKTRQWKGKKNGDGRDMGAYLRPQTLFRPSNFEAYLNEDEDGGRWV